MRAECLLHPDFCSAGIICFICERYFQTKSPLNNSIR